MLPRAPLVNLKTNHDDYQNVTKGKVLLVFVTTDCDACRKELANVSQVVPILASKVTVYGVGVDDRNSVNIFIEANHVALPILLDPGAVILSRLGFKFMPTKVLLQDGVITKIWYGSSPDRTALLKDVGEGGSKVKKRLVTILFVLCLISRGPWLVAATNSRALQKVPRSATITLRLLKAPGLNLPGSKWEIAYELRMLPESRLFQERAKLNESSTEHAGDLIKKAMLARSLESSTGQILLLEVPF